MKITPKYLENTLKKLAQTRPIFYNEADFQHELASLLNKDFPNQIRVEYPYKERQRMDIWILKEKFPIELKYLSKKETYKSGNEEFNFKRCSKVKRDKTIEKDKDRMNKCKGACIILSNDHRFIKDDWKTYSKLENTEFKYKIDFYGE